MSLKAGTRLGRYEICSQLGVGGMVEVYLAEDTKLDRKVALKILPNDVAAKPERMARFVREAKAARSKGRARQTWRNPQLQLHFDQIRRLPHKEQQFVLRFIDTVLKNRKGLRSKDYFLLSCELFGSCDA